MPKAILAIAGTFLGLLVGYVTRQTFLGTPVPLSVIVSNSPMDAPFRNELVTHLAIYGLIGLIIGLMLGYLVQSLSKPIA